MMFCLVLRQASEFKYKYISVILFVLQARVTLTLELLLDTFTLDHNLRRSYSRRTMGMVMLDLVQFGTFFLSHNQRALLCFAIMQSELVLLIHQPFFMCLTM